jgi:isoflavone-7-O-methyltransferase
MGSENGWRASELFQAQAHLYNHILSFLKPMSIKWVVELGIPDIIHNHGQPITLPQLLSALRIPEAKSVCVQSLMRLFFTIIEMEGKEAYALAPPSELLVKGTDHCLTSMVQLITNPNLVDLYNHLSKWTSGDELTIFETASGPGDYWGFIHQNPTHLKSFNEAMESDSHVMRLALSDCKPVFEGLGSLVDVGGGTGNTAKIICEIFPVLKCTVLDLPQVVAGLPGTEKLSFVGGNMFKSIPQADAILLKVYKIRNG